MSIERRHRLTEQDLVNGYEMAYRHRVAERAIRDYRRARMGDIAATVAMIALIVIVCVAVVLVWAGMQGTVDALHP